MSRSKQYIDALDRAGLKKIASLVASSYATLRRSKITKIYYQDDCWIQSDSDGSKASHDISWEDGLGELYKWTQDTFEYKYCPKSGDVILDIGAGIGAEAVYFSKQIGSSGKVFALEAHPQTFKYLKKTLDLNNIQNVIALNLAAASKPGTLYIETTDNYLANSVSTDQKGQEVSAVTLDSLCEEYNIKKIDFLKMNIEGAETDTLHGMSKSLEFCNNVAISCHDFLSDRHGNDNTRTKKDVTNILKEKGFKLYFRQNDNRDWIRDFVYGVRE